MLSVVQLKDMSDCTSPLVGANSVPRLCHRPSVTVCTHMPPKALGGNDTVLWDDIHVFCLLIVTDDFAPPLVSMFYHFSLIISVTGVFGGCHGYLPGPLAVLGNPLTRHLRPSPQPHLGGKVS